MSVSIRLLITVSVGLIVVCTAAGIWVPSVLIASNALKDARNDQLLGIAESVSSVVLGYFTRASSSALAFASMYESSCASNPLDAPKVFLDIYGNSVFSVLVKQPTLASVLIAHPRHDMYVSNQTGNNSLCDVDATLISSTYVSSMRYDTSGVTVPDCSMLSGAGCPGYARANKVYGNAKIANPLEIKQKMFDKDCTKWLGNMKNLWRMQGIPGDVSLLDTGLRGVEWFSKIVIVGKAPNDALYKKVYFSVTGPPWAPLSAFGALSQRIGTSTLGAGSLNLQDVLISAASSTEVNDIIFLVTSKRELLASSLPDQSTEVRYGHSGGLKGLTHADNTSMVNPSIVSVVVPIFDKYCTETACDWGNISTGTYVSNGFTTVLFEVKDPNAKGLDLLLVMMVEEDEVMKPATNLGNTIAVIASGIIVLFCFIAMLMAHMLTKPLHALGSAFDCIANMDMQNPTVQTVPHNSLIKEMNSMYRGFWNGVVMVEKVQSFVPVVEKEQNDTESSAESTKSGATSVAAAVVTLGMLDVGIRHPAGNKIATCMVVTCRGFEGMFTSQSVAQHTELFAFVFESAKAHHGQVMCISGTRIYVAWCVAKQVHGGGRVHSMDLSSDLLKCAKFRMSSEEATDLSIGIHTAPTYFGVLGSKYNRFQVLGSELQDVALSLSLMNDRLGLDITATRRTVDQCNSAAVYEAFRTTVLGVNEVIKIFWVSVLEEVAEAEWMYQLQEQSQSRVVFLDDFFSTLDASEITKFETKHPEHLRLAGQLRQALAEGRLTNDG